MASNGNSVSQFLDTQSQDIIQSSQPNQQPSRFAQLKGSAAQTNKPDGDPTENVLVLDEAASAALLQSVVSVNQAGQVVVEQPVPTPAESRPSSSMSNQSVVIQSPQERGPFMQSNNFGKKLLNSSL